MTRKSLIWMGLSIGSVLGSFVPTLWGDDAFFSMSSILFSFAGSILGIWVMWKITE